MCILLYNCLDLKKIVKYITLKKNTFEKSLYNN